MMVDSQNLEVSKIMLLLPTVVKAVHLQDPRGILW